jgi:hypothetical protein
MADHVFVCYARDDQEFVLKLAANLKERGVPVWLDQWDIPPSANWNKAIDNAIYECARFLIVLSPATVDSLEVQGEWITALEEKKPIDQVLHRQCRIPRQLRLFQHVDFTSCAPDDSAALAQVVLALNLPQAAPSEPPETEPETVIEPRVEPGTPEPPPPEPAKLEPRPREPKIPELSKTGQTLEPTNLYVYYGILYQVGWFAAGFVLFAIYALTTRGPATAADVPVTIMALVVGIASFSVAIGILESRLREYSATRCKNIKLATFWIGVIATIIIFVIDAM